MSWSIQEVARASGVTARTLRYYDEIALLEPARIGANGYRYYEREQLLRLQQILLLREMGLDLATIRGVVDTEQDPVAALRRHHTEVHAERDRLDRVAATVSATIRHLEEGTDMAAENLFEAISPERANYLASLPRKRVAAGAVFSHEDGRTLLVAPTYRPHWQLPGGVVDSDESPLAAATRAVRRELGLQVDLGRLLAVDWVPPTPGGIEGLLFVYEGGALSAEQAQAVTLPPAELKAWAWCTRDELAERLPAHMLRRTEAAMQARINGTTGYLENGSAAA